MQEKGDLEGEMEGKGRASEPGIKGRPGVHQLPKRQIKMRGRPGRIGVIVSMIKSLTALYLL